MVSRHVSRRGRRAGAGRDRVIRLDDPSETSECIALTIAKLEGVQPSHPAPSHSGPGRGKISRALGRLAGALAGGNGSGGGGRGGRRL